MSSVASFFLGFVEHVWDLDDIVVGEGSTQFSGLPIYLCCFGGPFCSLLSVVLRFATVGWNWKLFRASCRWCVVLCVAQRRDSQIRSPLTPSAASVHRLPCEL